MAIELRPAKLDDYEFTLSLCLKTIKPYASVWIRWVDAEQELRFAGLWRPEDAQIVVLDGSQDAGWFEFSEDTEEIFLKQLYVAPAHQGRGIGSYILTGLLDRACQTNSRFGQVC